MNYSSPVNHQEQQAEKTYVLDAHDFFIALDHMKQAVMRSFSPMSDNSYNNGIMRGIQISEDFAREFFVIEQKTRKEQTQPEGTKNGLGFSNI